MIEGKILVVEDEFDLRAPLGDTLLYETFHIEFEKTKSGWKISSMPGSF
jgi:hypothetical protein